LYTERGFSLRDIGEAHGVSTQTVRRWLIHAGIDRRRAAPRPAAVILAVMTGVVAYQRRRYGVIDQMAQPA
jgi:hypothetical protein